jgi:hypothetical protein
MPCHLLPDRHRRTVLVAAAAAAVMLLVGPVGTARNSVHLRRSVLAAAVAPAKEERPRERSFYGGVGGGGIGSNASPNTGSGGGGGANNGASPTGSPGGSGIAIISVP